MVLITIQTKFNETIYFVAPSIFDFLETKKNQVAKIYDSIISINYKKVNKAELNKYYFKIRTNLK